MQRVLFFLLGFSFWGILFLGEEVLYLPTQTKACRPIPGGMADIVLVLLFFSRPVFCRPQTRSLSPFAKSDGQPHVLGPVRSPILLPTREEQDLRYQSSIKKKYLRITTPVPLLVV